MFIGVYPDEYKSQANLLPWAEPAMGIAGGAWTSEKGTFKETGWCSAPHDGQGLGPDQGAQVFVFFEAGDLNKPVYFAAAQSGPGWFAEHPNQHVFQSDNVKVRIDENPFHEKSTCKFDAYIGEEKIPATVSQAYHDKRQNSDPLETRIDIEVEAKGLNAVNLNIRRRC